MLQPHMVTHERSMRSAPASSTSTIPRLAIPDRSASAVTELSARGFMAAVRRSIASISTPKRRITSRVISAAMPSNWPTRLRSAPGLQQHQLHVDWQEIVAIEFVGDEHVYDLTVEGLHSFVANNIIVHNCVYQEQIIQILSQLAGYTPGEADLVRRAISKKKASEIERHKQIFIEGCAQERHPQSKRLRPSMRTSSSLPVTASTSACRVTSRWSTRRPADLVRIEDLYTGSGSACADRHLRHGIAASYTPAQSPR